MNYVSKTTINSSELKSDSLLSVLSSHNDIMINSKRGPGAYIITISCRIIYTL